MAEHDDLSQLMPTLYSRIRLSSATEETSNLAQYARAQQALTARVAPVSSRQAADGMPQPKALMAIKPRALAASEATRGTGRIISHRKFDLQMRIPVAFASATQSLMAAHHEGANMSSQVAAAAMHADICAQPVCTAPAQERPQVQEMDTLKQRLAALSDISNARRTELRLRGGSGRLVAKRAFDLAMPDLALIEQQQPVPQPSEQAAALSPDQQTPVPGTLSRVQAKSTKSRKSSFGSAVEGVLERPWRSIGRKSQASRFGTPGTALRGTPMEGVPERFDLANTQHHVQQRGLPDQASTPVGSGRCEAVLRLQLSPGDEAQLLQKDSPVQGLLEAQHDPAPEHQPNFAEQYGSLGFFGSLNSAPPIYDTPGAVMQNDDSDDDMDFGFDDAPTEDQAGSPAFSSAAYRPATSPANLDTAAPSSAAAPAAAAEQQGQNSTPLHQQLHSSGLHLGLSAYHSQATAQGSRPTAHGGQATAQGSWATAQDGRPQAPSPAASLARPSMSSPHFREMQVQTGSSLPGTPAAASASQHCGLQPHADAYLASVSGSDPCQEALQQAGEDAQQAKGNTPKPVRKSQAHRRLKESNRQRRSLAGEGLHGEQGVRRSSRSKHAPLEYWRNERKVYNREFRSLPTVHHYATRTPSPSWKFVQDLPHKKRSRLALGKGAEANETQVK